MGRLINDKASDTRANGRQAGESQVGRRQANGCSGTNAANVRSEVNVTNACQPTGRQASASSIRGEAGTYAAIAAAATATATQQPAQPTHANRFRTAAAAMVSATVVAALVATGTPIVQPQQAYAATSSSSQAPTTLSQASKQLDSAIKLAQTARTNYYQSRADVTKAIQATQQAYRTYQQAKAAFDAAPRPSESAAIAQANTKVESAMADFNAASTAFNEAAAKTADAEVPVGQALEKLAAALDDLSADAQTNRANIQAAQAAYRQAMRALQADPNYQALQQAQQAYTAAQAAYVQNPTTETQQALATARDARNQAFVIYLVNQDSRAKQTAVVNALQDYLSAVGDAVINDTSRQKRAAVLSALSDLYQTLPPFAKAVSNEADAARVLASSARVLAEAEVNLGTTIVNEYGTYLHSTAVRQYLASLTNLARTTADEATAVGVCASRGVDYATSLANVVLAQHDYNELARQNEQANRSNTRDQVTKVSGKNEVSGSTFRKLRAKVGTVTTSTIAINWKKVNGAQSYAVYASSSVNGNLKYQRTLGSYTTSFTKRSLKKGTYHKFVVQALNARGKALATSKIVYAATAPSGSTKAGNPSSVKVAKSKKALQAGTYVKKLSLKKGKSTTLHAKAVKPKGAKVKTQRGLRYESSKASVVKVASKSGKLSAKKKGKATVYVYAQDGKYTTVKVTVK